MKIKIDVKKEHIINGVCGDVYNCAIALAVSDIFPNTQVCAHEMEFNINYNDNPAVEIPHHQDHILTVFDDLGIKERKIKTEERTNYLSPFSFEIDIPDQDLLKILPPDTIDEAKNIINKSQNCTVIETL